MEEEMVDSCSVTYAGLEEFVPVPKRNGRFKPPKRSKRDKLENDKLGNSEMGLDNLDYKNKIKRDMKPEMSSDNLENKTKNKHAVTKNAPGATNVKWEEYGFSYYGTKKANKDANVKEHVVLLKIDDTTRDHASLGVGGSDLSELGGRKTNRKRGHNRRTKEEGSVEDLSWSQSVFESQSDLSNGRPGMEHPTKVYGEVTRYWTPVFTLLEHKYIDKKTELGKTKRRGIIIPAGITYGRPNETRDGGSSEALHGWPRLSDTTLPFKRKEKTAQRDFMALNRAAVSAGLVKANDQYEFRATHDVRRKTQSEDSQRVRTRRIPPSMVFGISTRPSTPIFDLLEHKYQDKWLQQRRQMELAKRQEENKQRRCPGQVYETRASLLRTYQNPVDADPLWQMPKFTKEAKASLQTFRSADAKKRAYDSFGSDQISRRGNLGHGVFESAKN